MCLILDYCVQKSSNISGRLQHTDTFSWTLKIVHQSFVFVPLLESPEVIWVEHNMMVHIETLSISKECLPIIGLAVEALYSLPPVGVNSCFGLMTVIIVTYLSFRWIIVFRFMLWLSNGDVLENVYLRILKKYQH